MDPAVVTVGVIEAGTRWNVVAESGRIEGTTRCFSNAVYDAFPEMLDRIAKETAKAYRAEAGLTEYIELVPPTVNDPDMSEIAQTAARKVVAEDAPVTSPATMGGEDFAFYMRKAPGAVALLGIGNEECGAVWPQHSGRFCVDESALIKGAMLYAQVAMDFNAK